jgi:drug/metabolite transporter (DMT)-like permease
VAFAAHIVILADLAPRFDVVQLNAAQFAVVIGLLVVPGLVGGGYSFPLEVWLAAAYTGIFVTALAFGLQVWGQRRVSASRTALVLMLEPVFAAVLGYGAGERLGVLGALGAVVILGGIVVSEVGNTRAVPEPTSS